MQRKAIINRKRCTSIERDATESYTSIERDATESYTSIVRGEIFIFYLTHDKQNKSHIFHLSVVSS